MDQGLGRFNALPEVEARDGLRACCAAPEWISAVAAARPFPDRATLLDRARRELAALDWAALGPALDAHPRIGERVDGHEREAVWSRLEQSGTHDAPAATKAALAEANRAYEDRFGHVFLIVATGRTETEMLAAARERLGNDEATEREVVRGELGGIVALRLARLLDP